MRGAHVSRPAPRFDAQGVAGVGRLLGLDDGLDAAAGLILTGILVTLGRRYGAWQAQHNLVVIHFDAVQHPPAYIAQQYC